MSTCKFLFCLQYCYLKTELLFDYMYQSMASIQSKLKTLNFVYTHSTCSLQRNTSTCNNIFRDKSHQVCLLTTNKKVMILPVLPYIVVVIQSLIYTLEWWLIDFTLLNARQFYLSKRDPLGLKGLKADMKKVSFPSSQKARDSHLWHPGSCTG